MAGPINRLKLNPQSIWFNRNRNPRRKKNIPGNKPSFGPRLDRIRAPITMNIAGSQNR